MINPKEVETDQEFERKIRSAFPAQDPDQLFIDQLQKKLTNRFKDGNRFAERKDLFWVDKFRNLITPLAWGTVAILLVLALVWGIKNLLPGTIPVSGLVATPSPAPKESPQVVDVVPTDNSSTRAEGVIAAENASQITELAMWGKEPVNVVAWAPDGNSFAVAAATKIHIYDRTKLNETHTIDNGSSVYRIAYSPDGTKLAVDFDSRSAKIWDIASGSEILTLPEQADLITNLAFSPDGAILATGIYNQPLKLWAAGSGQELRILGGVIAVNVVFSPDWTLLATSGGEDKTVRLWDVASGQELRDLTGHSDYVYGLAFSPDGTMLASTSNDTTIKLWEVATGNELKTIEARAIPNGVAFLPDGHTLVSVAEDEPITLWDVVSGQNLRTVGARANSGNFSLSPDGKMILLYEWGGEAIKLLDITKGEELQGGELPTDEVRKVDWKTYIIYSLALSPDNRIIAVGLGSGGIILINAATGQELRSLAGHTKQVETMKAVLSLAFSPDGTMLASSAMDETTRVWDVVTGEEIAIFDGIPESGWDAGRPSVDFSPDGKLLVIAGPEGQVKVWDMVNHVERWTLGGVNTNPDADVVAGVAFSPDGTTIAAGYVSGSTILWDVSSGQELRTLKYETGEWLMGVSNLEFSPDGKYLAVGLHTADLVMWDITSGNKLYTVSFPWGELISDMDFSPDGEILAVAGEFCSIILLNAASGKELIDLKSPASGVVFSLDGKQLISGSYDGGIKLWSIPAENAMQPEATEVPNEGVLATPEVTLPTSEGINIDKIPIPTLLTGENLQAGEWSPDGSYFYYSQRGPIGEPGPGQALVKVSFLNALSGETCEGVQEIVNMIEDEFGFQPEGSELSERLRWMGDNHLLYLSLDGELMALTPCSGTTENWSSIMPESIVSLPADVKSDGSQIILQGEQAYWLFESTTRRSIKLNVPVPQAGMKSWLGWMPGEEKLFYSRTENREGLWMTIESIDPSSGIGSMLYEVQVSNSDTDGIYTLGIQWINENQVYIYDYINGDKLIDLSKGPVQYMVIPDIFGTTAGLPGAIIARGVTHSSRNQDTHVILQMGENADGQYFIYHPESGLVDQYPLDQPLLIVYQEGGGGIVASLMNSLTHNNIYRVILVDSDVEPFDLEVKGHAASQNQWVSAADLPDGEVLFTSSEGLSIVDLRSREIKSFWAFENQEQFMNVYSFPSPDGKTVVSFADLNGSLDEWTKGQAMYWLRLEP